MSGMQPGIPDTAWLWPAAGAFLFLLAGIGVSVLRDRIRGRR